MYCKSLHEELSLHEAGGKAYNLSQMLRDGFPVPKGFVILNNAFGKSANDLFIHAELKQDIIDQVKQIGAKKYMVRSSAVGEDSEQNSFAGQLQSFISEADTESLLDNIKKCWQSFHHQNVKAYEQSSGKKLRGMGVVVQELIEPDFAGVLFTESIFQQNAMLAEYVQGHGEKLVSGEVNPESFHCNKTDGKADKEIPFLFDEIYATALKLEEKFGCTQDIEWVIKDEKAFIVQSRPITTKTNTQEQKFYWSNTNVNENYPSAITPLLYSIARESYYHYFKNLSKLLQVSQQSIQNLERAYSNIIGAFGCRMYYNMSAIHSIISASPFSELLKKSFDNFVGYRGESAAEKVPATLKHKLRFLFGFLHMNLALKQHVKAFEERADAYSLQAKNASDLASFRSSFHGFIEIRMHSWYKASLADFFAMVYHGLLGVFCRKYYPENHEGIRNQLIQAIPNLVSSKPIAETWKIAQLINLNPKTKRLLENENPENFWQKIQPENEFKAIYQSIQKYLEEWGFRCSGELMLTETNYAEQPEKFIALLKQYCSQAQENPETIIARKYEERKEIIRSFRQKIWQMKGLVFPVAILHTFLLYWLVNLCSRGVASRERVRLKQALLYFRFKGVIHKIGEEFKRKKWLENSEDILYLKYQEITENLSTSDMLPNTLKDIVRLRKTAWQEQSKNTFPDDFSSFANVYPIAETYINTVNASGQLIKGLTACGGVIKGKAKVLESIMEAHKIEPGDILVTRQTDPGWACIFPLISGLIVERGGMLSHGAIVAREFGIPAIVGVEKATEKIPNGATVLLNANTGEVYLNV